MPPVAEPGRDQVMNRAGLAFFLSNSFEGERIKKIMLASLLVNAGWFLLLLIVAANVDEMLIRDPILPAMSASLFFWFCILFLALDELGIHWVKPSDRFLNLFLLPIFFFLHFVLAYLASFCLFFVWAFLCVLLLSGFGETVLWSVGFGGGPVFLSLLIWKKYRSFAANSTPHPAETRQSQREPQTGSE